MEVIAVRGSHSRYLPWAPKGLDSSLLAWIRFQLQSLPTNTFIIQNFPLANCTATLKKVAGCFSVPLVPVYQNAASNTERSNAGIHSLEGFSCHPVISRLIRRLTNFKFSAYYYVYAECHWALTVSNFYTAAMFVLMREL